MHSLTPEQPHHHLTRSTPHTPDSQTWTAQQANIQPVPSKQLEAMPSSTIVSQNLKELFRIYIIKASKTIKDLNQIRSQEPGLQG